MAKYDKTVEQMIISGAPDSDLYEKLECCEHIKRTIIGYSRWSINIEYVVREYETGQYYKYYVDRPATELQEFNINDDFIFQGQVKPVTKMVEITEYEPI